LSSQIYFCSFSDRRFHKSLSRIGKQARDSGFFKKIFLFNENDLSQEFKRELSYFLKPDTFYLCAWKPQVILQCLSKMKNGDILLYADSGCHINSAGSKKMEEYIERVTHSTSGILATTFNEQMPEHAWTKADCFDYFSVREDRSITNTPQIQATTMFVKKSDFTISFLNKWLKVFEDDPALADRHHFSKPNLEGYIEHRSDQSFFSVLGKLNRIELVSADEVQGSANWETEMIRFPIWAKRDKEIDHSFWANPGVPRLFRAIKRRVHKYLPF